MDNTPGVPDPDVLAAHDHSLRNREELRRSELCGCFCCCRVFPAEGIHEWVGRTGEEALCPHCGIDSVIGSASGFPITAEFLGRMREYWFVGLKERGSGHARIWEPVAAEQPYPLLFLTVSGAHLYAFNSADSDYDLRGVHILPARELLGLDAGRETIELSEVRRLEFGPPLARRRLPPFQLDLVTHDARKFFRMLLKHNGYVLEQLYSPLIVHTTPEHAELKEIARGCVTRLHAQHYLGFARKQWALFAEQRRIKALLYVYRILLTGIHLMRTGEVEANLRVLNDQYRLLHVYDLLAQKLSSRENEALCNADLDFHSREYYRLTAALEQARDASMLPEEPTARAALNDLLLRLRGLVNSA
jgi:predicted nucleotidyltransferase